MPAIKLADATPADIEAEVQRIDEAIARHALQLDYVLSRPLSDMVRNVIAHAAGTRKLKPQGASRVAQALCEVLWGHPTEAEYEIPDRFWDTILGQAVLACGGAPITLKRGLTVAEAAALVGVARDTIDRGAITGALPVYYMRGTRRIFLAAEVVAWDEKRRERLKTLGK